jgi:hypothetical protein
MGAVMADKPEAKLNTRDSLLLFCPYDRKVTRHARRWVDRAMVCTQCGNSVEVTYQGARREHFTGMAPNAGRAPASRSYTPARKGTGTNPLWIAAASAAVLIVGLLAVFTIAGNPFNGRTGPQVAATQSGTGAEVAGVSVTSDYVVRVANTEGAGVFVRRSPSTADHIQAWPDGTALTVIGPDTTEAGMTWRHVQDPEGNQGWVPAQYTDS